MATHPKAMNEDDTRAACAAAAPSLMPVLPTIFMWPVRPVPSAAGSEEGGRRLDEGQERGSEMPLQDQNTSPRASVLTPAIPRSGEWKPPQWTPLQGALLRHLSGAPVSTSTIVALKSGGQIPRLGAHPQTHVEMQREHGNHEVTDVPGPLNPQIDFAVISVCCKLQAHARRNIYSRRFRAWQEVIDPNTGRQVVRSSVQADRQQAHRVACGVRFNDDSEHDESVHDLLTQARADFCARNCGS
jgi:hypothetical protein